MDRSDAKDQERSQAELARRAQEFYEICAIIISSGIVDPSLRSIHRISARSRPESAAKSVRAKRWPNGCACAKR